MAENIDSFFAYNSLHVELKFGLHQSTQPLPPQNSVPKGPTLVDSSMGNTGKPIKNHISLSNGTITDPVQPGSLKCISQANIETRAAI